MLRMKPKICDKIVAICGLKSVNLGLGSIKFDGSKVLVGSRNFR